MRPFAVIQRCCSLSGTKGPNPWDCADHTCRMHFNLALARIYCPMHHESRSQKSSSSDPPTTGSSGDPGGCRQKTACRSRSAPGDGESPPAETWTREDGEALPFHSARDDRIRFRCAEACAPWLHIHGGNHVDPGSRQPSAACYPGHTAGPVLPHRPSETPPLLWTELEGLAM